ncbi:MAG: pantoate--beta-alanine ligase [Candidatus Omnitrophota bacterium]
MRIITSINDMTEFSRGAGREGRSIGFVPTMGYLHEGHMSLCRAARSECDIVVLSIFVNPAQFGPGEDLDKYPRDMGRDRRLAEKEGVDVIFAPEAGEMYPAGSNTYVEIEGPLVGALCARSRPGHFRGVATVVAKLFNIVAPDRSYFGQKDAQQAAIVKRMAGDLNMPVSIRVCPIVREEDGLAMSSRNVYLSREERKSALALYRSLERADEMARGGERSAARIREEVLKVLGSEKEIRVDYAEIVDADSLEAVEEIKDNTLVALAAFVRKTRLIDNVIIRLRP